MIDRKLILANAPNNMGQQVHINHVGCSSGEDKKKRLYIKRNDRGLVAYCHHCNESGFAGDDSSRMGAWLKAKDPINPRHTTIPVLSDLTIEGKMWLAKYYCDTTSKVFSGVKNNPKQVAMVLLDATTAHIGIQVRNLLPTTPKYITSYYSNTRKGEAAWFYYGNKTLVITEDYLSAYRTHTDGGVSTLALLRTALSDTTLRQIADLEFEHIFIWLDPDQAGIEGAKKIKQKLRHYLPISTSVHVMNKDKEPKEHTKEELSGLFHLASLL